MKRPRIVRGEKPGEYWAHFASGVAVELRASRARGYPGLASEAPDTESVYQLFLKDVPLTGKALDVGTGAGIGAAYLSQRAEQVIGVDWNGRALAFAKEFAPRATFLRADITTSLALADADIAAVVDVLGQVPNPLGVLRNVRRQLRVAGLVLVAEPVAHPTQDLLLPVHRAFTQTELERLLEVAGFEPLRWGGSETGFVGCLARCRPGVGHQVLEAGDHAWHAGQHREADRLFDEVADSGDAALAREARLRQATLHAELGMFGTATARYFEVKASAPDEPRSRSRLALLLAQLGRGYEALELARSAVELDPANRIAVMCLAAVAEELEHADAMSAWRVAHALAPDNRAVGSALARHLTLLQEDSSASSVLSRVARYQGVAALDGI